MKKLLLAVSAAATLLAGAAGLPEELILENAGAFRWNGISFRVNSIYGDWRAGRIAPAAGTARSADGSVSMASPVDYATENYSCHGDEV